MSKRTQISIAILFESHGGLEDHPLGLHASVDFCSRMEEKLLALSKQPPTPTQATINSAFPVEVLRNMYAGV